ncbi:MAG: hypothetical protein SFX73_12705 [Kofleriaceae bacterium]|nr:hypothetical protein [Kofleriaceae bacterium]
MWELARAGCIVAALAACGSAGKSTQAVEPMPVEPAQLEPICNYGMGVLYMAVASPHAPFSKEFQPAEDTAHREYELASTALEKQDHAIAASHHLTCSQAYAAVQATDPQRGHATTNAEVCFRNAAYNFASVGTFASTGKAKLEAAAVADPALRPALEKLLASPPHDCTQ